jgi:hypothetical protein
MDKFYSFIANSIGENNNKDKKEVNILYYQ